MKRLLTILITVLMINSVLSLGKDYSFKFKKLIKQDWRLKFLVRRKLSLKKLKVICTEGIYYYYYPNTPFWIPVLNENEKTIKCP